MSSSIREAQPQDADALTELLKSLKSSGWFASLVSESDETAYERITHYIKLSSAEGSLSIEVTCSVRQENLS